jgi:hypothetical protein
MAQLEGIEIEVVVAQYIKPTGGLQEDLYPPTE